MYQGAGFADRSQSIPVHFAIEGDTAGLRAGQFVTVLAETDDAKQGLAVPRTQHRARRQRPGFRLRARLRPSGSSRAACASSRSMASACCVAGHRARQAHRRRRAPNSRSRALRRRAMFTFLVTQSLRNRLFVLALAAVLVVFGAFTVATAAGRRLPGPQPADRHDHDRGGRPRAAGGRAARHLPDRDADERRAGRHARALGLGRRAVDRLRRVRLGHGHLPQPPAGRRAARAGARAAARATSTPQMGPISSIMGQILLVAVTSDRRASPMEVREIADFVIRPRLLTIPGVAQVIPIGGEVRQYRVAPQPAALRALGVTYEQIEKALAQFGTNTGGGFTDQYAREYLIRNIGRTTSLEDLRNIVVATVNGGPIYLRQVADVEFARQGQARRRRLHGQARRHRLGREAARRRHRAADARDRAGARRRSRARLPHGIKADQILFRQANFIETSIRNVERVLLEAVVGRRRRPVRVPAELAHDGHLADRHPGLDPDRRRSSSTCSGCPSTR